MHGQEAYVDSKEEQLNDTELVVDSLHFLDQFLGLQSQPVDHLEGHYLKKLAQDKTCPFTKHGIGDKKSTVSKE